MANADDPVGRRIERRWNARTFALRSDAELVATDLRRRVDGTVFVVHADGQAVPASVRGFGEFSVSNALAVLATAVELGVPLDDAVRRWPRSWVRRAGCRWCR